MEYLGVPDAVLMEIGSDMDCCKRALEELGTSVIEACTNAMEHGNQLDDVLPIQVMYEVEGNEITLVSPRMITKDVASQQLPATTKWPSGFMNVNECLQMDIGQ